MLLFAVMLSLCLGVTPTIPMPCPSPRSVASFTTSSEFNERAPLLFGGEVYVRATVMINTYTYWGRIIGFDSTTTPENSYGFTLSQYDNTGSLLYMGDGGQSVVRGTTPVPLGKPFLFEFTITRDSTVSEDGKDALGIIYINGIEYARSAVSLPATVVRANSTRLRL
eukprot:TRINITY_DN1217_c0_g1_i4.p1 TRINITY_DN1217_c0_g1~~TRINITY_DN1217_c0_g1_i4.p1  ORF type:complete len:167 (+),score=21.46 TRINITY_DN1217_c0_g1_i4:49-549(+)